MSGNISQSSWDYWNFAVWPFAAHSQKVCNTYVWTHTRTHPFTYLYVCMYYASVPCTHFSLPWLASPCSAVPHAACRVVVRRVPQLNELHKSVNTRTHFMWAKLSAATPPVPARPPSLWHFLLRSFAYATSANNFAAQMPTATNNNNNNGSLCA